MNLDEDLNENDTLKERESVQPECDESKTDLSTVTEISKILDDASTDECQVSYNIKRAEKPEAVTKSKRAATAEREVSKKMRTEKNVETENEQETFISDETGNEDLEPTNSSDNKDPLYTLQLAALPDSEAFSRHRPLNLECGNGLKVKIEQSQILITTPSNERIKITPQMTSVVTAEAKLDIKDGAIRMQSLGFDSVFNFSDHEPEST